MDFNPDAWPVVQAENRYNEPPRQGNRMVIARVGVTNVSADPDLYMVSYSDYSLEGSRDVVYKPFERPHSCGVIPDELLDAVYTGEYMEGNVCFQIPADETDLLLLYDEGWYDYVYFAVQ